MKTDHLIPHPIIIDNLLTEKQVKAVLDEIASFNLYHVSPARNYKYWTWFFEDDPLRNERVICQIFDNIWSDSRINDALEKNYNYASHMMKGADTDQTQVKIEGIDDECNWHRNDYASMKGHLILMTWLYYLKPKDNYTGGEFEYSFENIRQKRENWDPVEEPKETIKIENKHNRMVLIPSFFWHRVNPVKFTQYDSPLDGRISINGRVGYKLADSNKNLQDAVWTE